MKYITLFIAFILVNFKSLGQQWEFKGIIPHHKYKFEYIFNLHHDEDSNAFDLKINQTKVQKRTIKAIVVDKNNEPVDFAFITIRDSNNRIILQKYVNDSGAFSFETEFETVQLEINMLSYDKFLTRIRLNENQEAILKIKLGRSPIHGIYHIHAMRRLDEEEIESIINCVKIQRDTRDGNEFHKCENKKLFFLVMEI